MDERTSATTQERKPRRMTREPKLVAAPAEDISNTSPHATVPPPADDAQASKPVTKTQMILGLLSRIEGASLEQMVAATGWLPHTTRAALTGIKRKGHRLSSEKLEGVRIYRITPVGDPA